MLSYLLTSDRHELGVQPLRVHTLLFLTLPLLTAPPSTKSISSLPPVTGHHSAALPAAATYCSKPTSRLFHISILFFAPPPEPMATHHKFYFDGAAQPNPGKAGAGIVLYQVTPNPYGEHVEEYFFDHSFFLSVNCTNNEAEWMALFYGIQAVVALADFWPAKVKERSYLLICPFDFVLEARGAV